jgi:hypothetical protein
MAILMTYTEDLKVVQLLIVRSPSSFLFPLCHTHTHSTHTESHIHTHSRSIQYSLHLPALSHVHSQFFPYVIYTSTFTQIILINSGLSSILIQFQAYFIALWETITGAQNRGGRENSLIVSFLINCTINPSCESNCWVLINFDSGPRRLEG